MFRHIALNAFAGWLAGTLCSLGGALKDSPVEGFKARTFPRSMLVATVWGLVSIALTDDFFMAFAFAGYFERLSVEGWKIIRAKRPSKFVGAEWVTEWGHRQPLPRNESTLPLADW
jgi:hypothetical protein